MVVHTYVGNTDGPCTVCTPTRKQAIYGEDEAIWTFIYIKACQCAADQMSGVQVIINLSLPSLTDDWAPVAMKRSLILLGSTHHIFSRFLASWTDEEAYDLSLLLRTIYRMFLN